MSPIKHTSDELHVIRQAITSKLTEFDIVCANAKRILKEKCGQDPEAVSEIHFPHTNPSPFVKFIRLSIGYGGCHVCFCRFNSHHFGDVVINAKCKSHWPLDIQSMRAIHAWLNTIVPGVVVDRLNHIARN